MEPKLIPIATLFTLLVNQLSPYNGPFVVSLLAAVARLMYAECPATLQNFVKLWGMALFISIMAYHIARWQEWPIDLSVPVWGFCAFLSKEIFDTAKAIPSKLVPIFINRYGNK